MAAVAGHWESLPLSKEVLRVIREVLRFEQMTPVQAATLPKFLQHKDVAVEAPTGSGKTLAFVIPVLEKLIRREEPLKQKEVGAIIITPTRELAQQIYNVTKTFTDNMQLESPLTAILLVGGTDVETDISNFKQHGGNIVIATPGRLEDIMNRLGSEFKVKELEVLILDEADRLLDMGFHMTLTSIISRLPKQRRTGLFSATQTHEVSELMKAGLRNPTKIVVKVQDKATQQTQAIPATLKNYYTVLAADQKLSQLAHFLVQNSSKKTIVYFLTCACVKFFWNALRHVKGLEHVTIFTLHGQMPQKKRLDVYTQFSEIECGVLLSTDVSARGLDFSNVDWIIQFDPPQDPNFFVHRIGRTARIGREGNALVYLHPHELTFIDFLHGRGVPITEMSAAEGVEDQLPHMKKAIMQEREFLEKSHVAFISYIRAYKEHKLNFIFRLKDLDFAKLARSFCLLRLPKVKELYKVGPIDFQPEDIDLDTIPYKDKHREKIRQRKLRERAEAKAKENEQGEDEEMELPEEEEEISESEDDNNVVDESELAKEARLMKKLKKGKISKAQFEKEVGDDLLEKEVEAQMIAKYARQKKQNQKKRPRNDKQSRQNKRRKPN